MRFSLAATALNAAQLCLYLKEFLDAQEGSRFYRTF